MPSHMLLVRMRRKVRHVRTALWHRVGLRIHARISCLLFVMNARNDAAVYQVTRFV
jgi:hypothetical protein